ncbi:MAG: DUF5519 family protein [Planctomycetes bacterium]|nr:DUF5519 family protein [Planctomycetota bacterium]
MTLRDDLSARLQALGATLSPSRFGGELAFHLGRRELAHFHDAFTLDLRITRKGFRELEPSVRADPRIVSPDAGKRDWIEVRFRRRADLAFVEALARHAVRANG